MNFYKFKIVRLFSAILILIFSCIITSFGDKHFTKTTNSASDKNPSLKIHPLKEVTKFSKNKTVDKNEKTSSREATTLKNINPDGAIKQSESPANPVTKIQPLQDDVSKEKHSDIQQENPPPEVVPQPIPTEEIQADTVQADIVIAQESKEEWNKNLYVNTSEKFQLDSMPCLKFKIKIVKNEYGNYIFSVNINCSCYCEDYECIEKGKSEAPMINVLSMNSVINFFKAKFKGIYEERKEDKSLSQNFLDKYPEFDNCIKESDFNLFDLVDIIVIDNRVKMDKPFNLNRDVWLKTQRGLNCIIYVRKEFLQKLTLQKWYDTMMFLPMLMY